MLVHSGESDGVVEDAEYGGDGAARSTPGWSSMAVIDGRDDEGDAMKMAVFKGISYISRAKKTRIKCKWNLGLYF